MKLTTEVTVNEEQLEKLESLFPLLALDPGLTIGTAYCSLDTARKPWEPFNLNMITMNIAWPHDAETLTELMRKVKTIVIEGFQVFPKTSAAGPIDNSTLTPIEVRGFARGLLASELTSVALHTVQPASSKAMWTNEGMKEQLSELPPSTHQKDAVRLVLFTLVTSMTQRDKNAK